ncbi:MAG: hypothetical protein U9O96_03460 [Candidatus Thermoplasmatota archaeon]|nr:hypothetical protein [Candidatus Thermoplasmatota archaeon]
MDLKKDCITALFHFWLRKSKEKGILRDGITDYGFLILNSPYPIGVNSK